MPIFSPIRALLTSGQTAEALNQLSAWAENQPAPWRQALLLLQASWAQNEQEAASGAVSYEDAARMRTRITKGVIAMLDQFESGTVAPQAVLDSLRREFPGEPGAQNHINVQDSDMVVVGTGNTVTKKVFSALGRRQFWLLILGLAVLLAGGYFGVNMLAGKQTEAFASLSDIKKELAVLTDLNGELRDKLGANQTQLDDWLAKGMDALKTGDFATATQYLEKVASEAPLATVHQNLAYAYEQLGNAEKARENHAAAQKINPNLATGKSFSQLKGQRIDLFAPENGGKILVSSSERMNSLVDGNTNVVVISDNEFAVFGFKDGRAATFSQFAYYIPETSRYNLLNFELFSGNDTPTGAFRSIGKFNALNALLTETPFQEFNFAPVTARYLKVQLSGVSPNGYSYEMKLMGEIK